MDPSVGFKSDTDLASYAIMVQNIPQNKSIDEMQTLIGEAMLSMFPGIDDKSPFIKVRVCGDFEKLYDNCVRLKRSIEKLKISRAVN